MLDAVTNFAIANVSTGYDASATSIVLATGKGALFPTPNGFLNCYNLVWWNSTDYANPADDPNAEIVRVTGRSTDTLTVVRAQDGTSASAKNTSGKTYKVMLAMTKSSFEDALLLSPRIDPSSSRIAYIDQGGSMIFNGAAISGGSGATGGSGGHMGYAGTGTSASGGYVVRALFYSVCFDTNISLIKFRVSLNNLSSATDRYKVHIGLIDGADGLAPVDGAYFTYTDNEASGNWRAFTRNNSSETEAAGGTSVPTAKAWSNLVIVGTSSKVQFYVNEVFIGESTTNIPSSLSRSAYIGMSILKSVGIITSVMSFTQTQALITSMYA